MKRSEINDLLDSARAFFAERGFALPPFAGWSPEELLDHRPEIGPIIAARLGWDLTDFGQGAFDETGQLLFTLRNGTVEDLRRGSGMCYAEKAMVSRREQIVPLHRHLTKGEDLINRGGGTLAVKLHGSDGQGHVDYRTELVVVSDGLNRRLPPGGVLRLAPGESVSLPPGLWHAHWAEGADVLVGEVSTVNDDITDNIFRDHVGRLGPIEEDEPPRLLLVSDYGRWFG